MTPLSAVRLADLFVLGASRERSEPAAWTPLSDGLEGAASATPQRASILWAPEGLADGMHPLSLYEHGEYLCRIPPGARWSPRCEALFAPVSSALGASGMWILDVRGRAGSAVLQALSGDRALFTLPIALRARKLDHLTEWRAMLDALGRLRVDLCLSPRDAPAEIPIGLAPSATGPASAWERFVLLRYLARSDALGAALAAIERAPLTALGATRRTVPTAQATRARPEDLASSSSPPGASGLPRTVSESRPESSLDTPENRFVNTVLERLADDARALTRDPQALSLHAASASLAAHFESLRRGSCLRHVGALSSSAPIHSAALQRRAGYRELLSLWMTLGASRPALAWRDADASPEPVRDTSSLYERWCALTVCRLLDVPDARAARLLEGPASVRATVLGRPIELSSQRTFSAREGSYSLPFRPDLTLTAAGRRLLLDAKYQLQSPSEPELADLRELTPWASSGLVKMHAYRDAIDGVWGAAVLYPGDEREPQWFEAPEGGGTGALPLRPTIDETPLEQQISSVKTLIERFVTVCDKSTE